MDASWGGQDHQITVPVEGVTILARGVGYKRQGRGRGIGWSDELSLVPERPVAGLLPSILSRQANN